MTTLQQPLYFFALISFVVLYIYVHHTGICEYYMEGNKIVFVIWEDNRGKLSVHCIHSVVDVYFFYCSCECIGVMMCVWWKYLYRSSRILFL